MEETMSTMNLTLLTDFYELTMMQGYFKTLEYRESSFDAFYRKIHATVAMRSLPDWIR